ncbi:MAG: PIN domain-containing protein [Phycisphaerales bacterium]|nr:PIN domain-containing protein [Phycisphaerales bacterium]
MKLRIYLDTSVFSAYDDERMPDRRQQTHEFMTRRKSFELSSSELAERELSGTPDPTKRSRLLALLGGISLHPVSTSAIELARRYVEEEVFSPRDVNDALHVAVAVLTRQDVLVSWNFRHLVNRLRRAKVQQVNVSLGLPTVEIVAPPEV